ncbi:hypothetical protein S245_048951, partial [Arachis hypogaea]
EENRTGPARPGFRGSPVRILKKYLSPQNGAVSILEQKGPLSLPDQRLTSTFSIAELLPSARGCRRCRTSLNRASYFSGRHRSRAKNPRARSFSRRRSSFLHRRRPLLGVSV